MTRISNEVRLLGRPSANIATWFYFVCLAAAVALGMLASMAPKLTLIAIAAVLLGAVTIALELRFPGTLVFLLMVGYAWKDRALSNVIREVSGVSISPTEIVLVVTIAVWLSSLAVGRKWRSPRWVPGVPAIGLLAAWTMIPFVQGMNYSLVETMRAAVPVYYILFYFLSIFFVRSWEQFRFALIWFVGALAASLVIWVLPLPRENWFLTPGSFAFVLIPVFMFLSVPVAALSKRSRWVLLPCWGLSLVYLSSTGSRSTLVALFVTGLVFVLLNVHVKRFARVLVRSLLFIIPVSLVLGSAAYVFMPEKLEYIGGITATIFLKESDGSFSGRVAQANVRLLIWQAILDEANQHPLYGIGLGTPWEGFALVDNPESWWGGSGVENMARLGYANPHNTFVHILLRMGWIGMLLYALVWSQILWTIHRQSLRINKQQVRLAINVLWMSSLYLLIFTFFLPILETPSIGLMPWVFAGVAVALVNIYRVGSSSGGGVSANRTL